MGILAEVDRAIQEIKTDQVKAILWQQVFSKYPPAFISDCERSVGGARVMVKEWLTNNMCVKADDPESAADAIVSQSMNYSGTSEHSHHFLRDKCAKIGLNIVEIEEDQDLQEGILSAHHSFMASFDQTDALKIIDNSTGGTWSVGSEH